MFIVNIFLTVQIRAAKIDKGIFIRERRYLLLILFLFELSYGMRFMYRATARFIPPLSFEDCILYDLLSLIDGLSFLALLVFHYRNFTAYSATQDEAVSQIEQDRATTAVVLLSECDSESHLDSNVQGHRLNQAGTLLSVNSDRSILASSLENGSQFSSLGRSWHTQSLILDS